MDYEARAKRCAYNNARYRNMAEEQRERRLKQMRDYAKLYRQGIRKGRRVLTEEERVLAKSEYNRCYREKKKREKQDANS